MRSTKTHYTLSLLYIHLILYLIFSYLFYQVYLKYYGILITLYYLIIIF